MENSDVYLSSKKSFKSQQVFQYRSWEFRLYRRVTMRFRLLCWVMMFLRASLPSNSIINVSHVSKSTKSKPSYSLKVTSQPSLNIKLSGICKVNTNSRGILRPSSRLLYILKYCMFSSMSLWDFMSSYRRSWMPRNTPYALMRSGMQHGWSREFKIWQPASSLLYLGDLDIKSLSLPIMPCLIRIQIMNVSLIVLIRTITSIRFLTGDINAPYECSIPSMPTSLLAKFG